MSRAIIALALAVVIVASPVPQMLDIGDIIDAGAPPTASVAASPTIIRLNPTVLAASAAAAITQAPVSAAAGSDIATSTFLPYSAPTMAKRQANSSGCSTRPAQPTGAGPSVVPDTPSAFLSYSSFAASASSAPVPAGFAAAFTNLNAENSAVGYLGYTLLASYDTAGCANMCNNIFGCQAINVLFERGPSVDPGYGCDNPASTTLIKCVFWGTPVNTLNAVNSGQWRDNFQVVVAGSNGYVRTTFPTVAGYGSPTVLGNASINALDNCAGTNTYLGYKLFSDGFYDPARCLAACTAQSNYNLAYPPTPPAKPQTCQFVNTYLLLKDGYSQGQICALYSSTWGPSYATNTGYTFNTDTYTIALSLTYSNATNPGNGPKTCTFNLQIAPTTGLAFANGLTYAIAEGPYYYLTGPFLTEVSGTVDFESNGQASASVFALNSAGHLESNLLVLANQDPTVPGSNTSAAYNAVYLNDVLTIALYGYETPSCSIKGGALYCAQKDGRSVWQDCAGELVLDFEVLAECTGIVLNVVQVAS